MKQTLKTASVNTNKLKKRWIVTGLISGLLFLWLIFTVLLPILRGDGTESLKEPEKGIAKSIVALNDEYVNRDKLLPSLTYIDDIRPATQDEVTKYCNGTGHVSDNINDRGYYAVSYTLQELGSLKNSSGTFVGCQSKIPQFTF